MNNSGQIGKQILHMCESTECRLKTSINNRLRSKSIENSYDDLHLIVLGSYVVELNNQ